MVEKTHPSSVKHRGRVNLAIRIPFTLSVFRRQLIQTHNGKGVVTRSRVAVCLETKAERTTRASCLVTASAQGDCVRLVLLDAREQATFSRNRVMNRGGTETSSRLAGRDDFRSHAMHGVHLTEPCQRTVQSFQVSLSRKKTSRLRTLPNAFRASARWRMLGSRSGEIRWRAPLGSCGGNLLDSREPGAFSLMPDSVHARRSGKTR